jgi:acetolactate synthase small subunit
LPINNLMETDEQNQLISKEVLPVKLRMKERSRSQTTTNTDINDPENLDYEEEDAKTEIEQKSDPVKKRNNEIKSSVDKQVK